MFTLTNFLENTTAGALPLKPFERTFQGLIFADTNLGHSYPSPRSYNALPETGQDGRTAKPYENYTAKTGMSQPFFRSSAIRDG